MTRFKSITELLRAVGHLTGHTRICSVGGGCAGMAGGREEEDWGLVIGHWEERHICSAQSAGCGRRRRDTRGWNLYRTC